MLQLYSWQDFYNILFKNVKGKVHPIAGHEGPEGE